MPDDASGNFSLVSGYLAVTGQTVQPSNHNPPLEDIAAAMTNRLSRSGVAPMTGPLKTVTGSASAPAIYPNSNPAIGIYWTPTGISFAGSVSGVRFIGELIPYTLLSAPALTVFPYGQTLLRASYPDLWALAQADIAAGNTFYNNGNGSTTFGIGDLRGRVVAGKDNMGGTSAHRLGSGAGFSSGGGGDPAILGAVGGLETHTLTTAQLSVHSHANLLNDGGHGHPGSKGRMQGKGGGAGSFDAQIGTNETATQDTQTLTIASSTTGITISNANAGSGDAHNNTQPTMICNYLLYAGA